MPLHNRSVGWWRLLFIPLVSGACGTGASTATVRLDPLQVNRQSPTAMLPVAFMAGCWLGTSDDGGTVIEERWSPPSENVMVGTTRFLRDGRTVGFEFGHLEARAGEVIYTPYPSGNRSPDVFVLTKASPGEALFEAPEHDYPKRIQYRVGVDGGLRAQIDGGEGDPEPRGWSLERSSCEGS